MTQQTFNAIGLIGKQNDPRVGEALDTLSHFLLEQGLSVYLDEVNADAVTNSALEVCTRNEIGKRCDLAIVVGGDGTLLNAARALADHHVPLAGVNLGRLGFLTDISHDNMLSYLGDILQGQYITEERFLLDSAVIRQGEKLNESTAFNDVVIHKWNAARMIELETYVNGKLVNQLRSDGLIIATPTGSTAYALSAGGPIIDPTLNALLLVPVCPHTMSNRPIVISGDNEIEVIIGDRNHVNAQVTCDGQISFGLSAGDRIKIRKKEQPILLIHPLQHDHYEILRAKLHWAETS
ncbi:MAG: NAD(+) kinase [Thiotrichaceae bacterium]|nr:NAD(+) kinase [Thiotrichaceae bacterium]PCI11155.1 MAG: NAD(+) kinase [Thiotrichales bacterium]PCI12871.1 MAG: NAD(+) kinase [Thiotrichales bacterium]